LGNSREETIARLRRSLEEYTVTGIKTNAALFRRILGEPEFVRGEIHTTWLDELLLRKDRSTPVEQGSEDAAAIGAAVWQAMQNAAASSTASALTGEGASPRWKLEDASSNWTARHEIRSKIGVFERNQNPHC